jgi:hypothetical protein
MTYQDLLASAIKDPSTANFTQPRLLYAETPDYDPYRRDE